MTVHDNPFLPFTAPGIAGLTPYVPGKPVSEGGLGYSCIAEVRTVETILRGAAETPLLKHGDTVRIEMLDDRHHSIFGAIEQTVAPLSSAD